MFYNFLFDKHNEMIHAVILRMLWMLKSMWIKWPIKHIYINYSQGYPHYPQIQYEIKKQTEGNIIFVNEMIKQ